MTEDDPIIYTQGIKNYGISKIIKIVIYIYLIKKLWIIFTWKRWLYRRKTNNRLNEDKFEEIIFYKNYSYYSLNREPEKRIICNLSAGNEHVICVDNENNLNQKMKKKINWLSNYNKFPKK